MKKKLLNIIIIICVAAVLPWSMGARSAGETVYLCGMATGFEVSVRGALVIGLSDVVTENGIYSPSKDAGIACGDRIVNIGDTAINCAFDITKALKGYTGGEVVVELIRGEQKLLKDVTPRKDVGGRYKLGLFVRDALEGIGTLTFVKKDGTFMALGHPVCDEDGKKSDIVGGKIMSCSICGVNKGERGRAGELKGAIIGDKPVGEITANYQQGIKGIINDNFDLSELCEIEIGTGVVGKAEIFCCVDGKKVEAYAVSVVKAEHDGREDKNFVVKVTDKRLIRSTGGIVQGMSGSPIVQGGKLIGALTHVFTNDPTRGYGISAWNMLAVCDEPQEKAA